MTGKVYLVGAGPGDIELITVKGLNCLKTADVIIYDSLIKDNLLNYAKDSAEKIFAGKRAGNHSVLQEEINRLLVQKARENKKVARLKGGDPFVFGRGGEEALYLKENNVEFEIIPGITSAIAGAAYAGIPVTHRGISNSFHVVNGHNLPEEYFKVLSKLPGTLVFLMGVSNLENTCSELMKHGKSPETPVAVVSSATGGNQKTIIGTLSNVESCETPAIIIIGDVVNLRESIQWFENKPLYGRNIVVTRAKHRNKELMQKIEQNGGNAVEFPTIEIKPLDVKLPNLKQYDWLIFTSINGVELFFNKLQDVRDLGNVKVCAVGDSTAECIKKYHIKPIFTPDDFVSEALIEGLRDKIKPADRILLPKAEQTRSIIPDELKKISARVDELVLYRTVIPEYNKQLLKDADSVCFMSPSAVKNFPKEWNNLKAYCIGPITSNAAKEAGFKEVITAGEYSIKGLMEKLYES